VPISPFVMGNTRTLWVLPFLTDSGIVNLTGAPTLSLRIQWPDGTGHTGTNVPTISGNPVNGIVNYQPSAADFPAIGTYSLELVADFGGGSILISDPFSVLVTAKI